MASSSAMSRSRLWKVNKLVCCALAVVLVFLLTWDLDVTHTFLPTTGFSSLQLTNITWNDPAAELASILEAQNEDVNRANSPEMLDDPNTVLKRDLFDFVESRRKAFEEVNMGRNFWLRGVGHLWEMRDMAVAIESVSTFPYPVKVRMVNLHPNSTGRDCEKLHVWVRVDGPEVVGGLATSISTGDSRPCYWEYTADVRVEGNYSVDAKLLSWNAQDIQPDEMRCETFRNENVTNDIMDSYKHFGFKGFKLYSPDLACCEICSRLPGCVHWATPPFKLENPSDASNGCELFFERDYDDNLIPKSYLLGDLNSTYGAHGRRLGPIPVHGKPHTGRKMWFLGCGWSQSFTLDFPCMSGELDDKVFALEPTFRLNPTTLEILPSPATTILPLCDLDQEYSHDASGRWVKEPWPTHCPKFQIDNNRTKFVIHKWTADQPHCWHRDDFTRIGHHCIEMNCKFIQQSSKWQSGFRVKKWMGVWRDRRCDLLEFTDAQLQTCIEKLHISKFEVTGRSISVYMNEYLQQRTSGLNFYNGTEANGTIVELSTLALLHKAMKPTDVVRIELSELPNSTSTRPVFVVGPMFLSSERETLAIHENLVRVNALARDVLQSKGYNFFTVSDASAPMVYDVATQFDGMHLIGPPMKLIITKFFHYLCKDHVEGSRV
jgi:hypothetical protein